MEAERKVDASVFIWVNTQENAPDGQYNVELCVVVGDTVVKAVTYFDKGSIRSAMNARLIQVIADMDIMKHNSRFDVYVGNQPNAIAFIQGNLSGNGMNARVTGITVTTKDVEISTRDAVHSVRVQNTPAVESRMRTFVDLFEAMVEVCPSISLLTK